MKLRTIALASGLALLLGASQASFAGKDKAAGKVDKKDHPNMKIT